MSAERKLNPPAPAEITGVDLDFSDRGFALQFEPAFDDAKFLVELLDLRFKFPDRFAFLG